MDEYELGSTSDAPRLRPWTTTMPSGEEVEAQQYGAAIGRSTLRKLDFLLLPFLALLFLFNSLDKANVPNPAVLTRRNMTDDDRSAMLSRPISRRTLDSAWTTSIPLSASSSASS
jgi:hypothetical protein